MSERLQKVLAKAGFGSRRACEDLIRAGRVKVDGVPAALGDRVQSHLVQVLVDGVAITLPDQPVYLKFYKPPGYLSSTRSQGGHPTIYNLISIPRRVFPAGRLDLHSEGLMLLTDDGNLTQRLTHPSYQHEKEYRVLFQEAPTPAQISSWQKGLQLPDGVLTQPAQFFVDEEEAGNTWCRIILREGRKRQIRNMASVLGLTVLRLIRIRIALLELGPLAPGQTEECTAGEVAGLLEAFKHESPKSS